MRDTLYIIIIIIIIPVLAFLAGLPFTQTSSLSVFQGDNRLVHYCLTIDSII